MRVDLHLHSKYSHDSRTSLEELVARAAECGLDRIALTDHNTAEGSIELARLAPELAIVAEEVRTTEGEVVALFIQETIKPWRTPEWTLAEIKRQGGLTYLAHPLDRRRANWNPARILQLQDSIDIIEVYNPWSTPDSNEGAARLCRELGKVAATGSDAHGVSELGLSWMEMEEFDGPQDFLAKLASATHHVSEQSGKSRRA